MSVGANQKKRPNRLRDKEEKGEGRGGGEGGGVKDNLISSPLPLSLTAENK